MAPKKSAKRVIQVPEEEEPPAKKLQTSLKRHGVKELAYRQVADVFSHPAAAHLSQDCKDMFLAALPFSLVTASDERNEFQASLVCLADKVIMGVLAGMQESLDGAEEKLKAADAEKVQLDKALETAEEELKSAKACTAEKSAALAAATTAMTAAKAKLHAAKEAQAAQRLTAAAASAEKAQLQDAVSGSGCFGRLKAGDFSDSGEAGRLFSSLEPLVLEKLKTDSSLKTAMRCSLLKKPESRGQFDGMLLEELAKNFEERISTLETDLGAADAVAAELAEGVAAAEAALQTATAVQKEATSMLSTSSAAEKLPAASVQAAKAALLDFKPKHLQARGRSSAERQQLQSFVDTNMAAFASLKDRVSAKKAKELAAKAGQEELPPATEVNLQASAREDAKLVDDAEAIAASMLEGSIAGPEVGGA